MKRRENFGIGALFLGPVVRRYQSSLSQEELDTRLNRAAFIKRKENGDFLSNLTFFNIMFPFGHFAKIKGRILKNGVIELTISPIIVRAVQLVLITLYSITLSAVRLNDNRSWAVLAILGLHFGVLCLVWWFIRLVYVADARHKYHRVKKWLELSDEEE